MNSIIHVSVELSWATVNTLNADSTKWSNTLKKIRRLLSKNGLSGFNYFVGLALKGLTVCGQLR